MPQLDIFNNYNYNNNCSGSNQSFKCIKCLCKSNKIINCSCSEEQLVWTVHRTNAGYHYHICKYCKYEDNKISQFPEIKNKN